jgi:hypothetical protein
LKLSLADGHQRHRFNPNVTLVLFLIRSCPGIAAMGTRAPSLSAEFIRHVPKRRGDLLREEFDLKPSPAHRQARRLMGVALTVLAVLLGYVAAQAVLIVVSH